MSWKTWTTAIVGLWLLLAAFLGFTPQANLWNDLIVGSVAIVAGFGLIRTKPRQGWIAGVLGAWLVVAAFVPSFVSGAGLVWNNAIVGTLIALSGFAAVGSAEPPRSGRQQQPHATEPQHLHQP